MTLKRQRRLVPLAAGLLAALLGSHALGEDEITRSRAMTPAQAFSSARRCLKVSASN